MRSHNFPEDRALVREEAKRGEASLSFPYLISGGNLVASELQSANELAFAVLFIFSRTSQLEDACVKVRLPGPSEYFASVRLSADAPTVQSLASLEFSQNCPSGLPEIDLLVCHRDVSEGLISRVSSQPNLLVYSVGDSQLHLKLHFDKNLVAPVTAFDFLEKVGLVLASLSDGSTVPGPALSLATASAAQWMPNLANPIEAANPDLLPVKFFEVADKYAEQPAIAGLDFVYSYGHLKNHTLGIVNDLMDAGVCVGDVVSISGASSFGTIASILAVMAAGGVVVVIDQLLPDERRKLIADISAPRFNIRVGAQDTGNAPAVKTLATADWPDPNTIEHQVLRQALPSMREYERAYIFFTSGSSGIPKGVLGSHLGLAHFLDWQRFNFPIGPGDRTAQLTALSFDVVLRDLFYPLTSGACIHIPKRDILLDARKMLGWVKSRQITAMHCVPSLMRAWLLADAGDRPFASIKYIFFAGEPLTDSLLRRFRESAAEATHITNLYGPTETTLAKLFNRIDRIEDGVQPVGIPQPGVDVVMLKNRSTVCGLWETGEIAIRTPYRSKGYFQNPELTEQAFGKNPWRDDPEDLIYFTGDLGRYRSDGKVEIFGRIDAQIKIRGVRIEPNEIESCILSFPGMKDAAVTTRNGASGDKVLLAVVVPKSFENFDAARQAKALRDALKEKLQDAMVPARIMFMERLPYLPNGKLDRKTIAAMDFDIGEKDARANPVHFQVDEKLRRVISEIEKTLGLQVHDLGKSFVDLGGDSLSYIRISFAIEKEFGVLPAGWHHMPLEMLGAKFAKSNSASQEEKSAVWVFLEPAILLRALAIFFVVLGHATSVQIIGTSTLFVISGMSFAKFFRNDILSKGDLTPVIKFILRFAIPAGLWELLAAATKSHPFWLPDFFLMGTYFHHPNEAYYTLWFLDVLAANILIISLVTLIFGKYLVSGNDSKPMFSLDFGLVLFGLTVSFLQVGTGWGDGVLGETSVAPFKWFWMLALGVAIAQAASIREKLVLSLFLAAVEIANLAEIPLIDDSFDALDRFFYISAMALVWLNRVPMPRIFRHVVIGIASASLFIYIVNHTVIDKVSRLLNFEGAWLVTIAMALASGIACSWIWTRLEVLARQATVRLKPKVSATY
jgi:amino acid adenylation domain-containing protein